MTQDIYDPDMTTSQLLLLFYMYEVRQTKNLTKISRNIFNFISYPYIYCVVKSLVDREYITRSKINRETEITITHKGIKYIEYKIKS